MLGGLWMVKIGINRGLWLFGAVQLVSILGFAWLAWENRPDRLLLAGVIAFEALGVGLGTAAFVAFIARATDPRYTATQFALFTSLAALPRTVVNASTGLDRRATGWFVFFLVCAALALPGMALLLRVAPWIERKAKDRRDMNHHKFSAIAHRDHDYCNPISAAKIERLLDLLTLDENTRVLDLGCGRAELALRIIERFGSSVVAVDNSSPMLDAARERAEWTGALHKLHLDDVDIRDFRADPETFHLTVMMGAGGIAGRHGRASATR